MLTSLATSGLAHARRDKLPNPVAVALCTTTWSGRRWNLMNGSRRFRRCRPQDLVTFLLRQAESELRGAVGRTEARLRAAGDRLRVVRLGALVEAVLDS
jgi:hypothetical protein